MSPATFLTGQFLLAMPGIGDPRFDRAVIAMCAHDREGAIGVGVGATIDGLGLHEVLGQLGIEPGDAPDAPVHFGGPVEPRRGFVLHSRDWGGQDTIDVAGRWSLSGTTDVLRAIAAGQGPSRWLVALGYAGWGEGQLDGEMTRHGWFNVPGDTVLLYDVDVNDRWQRGFPMPGSIRACWSGVPGRRKSSATIFAALNASRRAFSASGVAMITVSASVKNASPRPPVKRAA